MTMATRFSFLRTCAGRTMCGIGSAVAILIAMPAGQMPEFVGTMLGVAADTLHDTDSATSMEAKKK